VVVALTLVMILAGCAESNEEPVEPETLTPVPGGRLAVLLPGVPSTLDPHCAVTPAEQIAALAVTNPLLLCGTGGEVEPAAAQEWSVSEDGLAWTFKVRKGLTFHDEAPCDAAAVKANLDRMLELFEFSGIAPSLSSIREVEVLDEHELVVHLRYPNVNLPYDLAQPCAGLVSPRAVEEMGDEFARRPVGLGPFKFEGKSDGELRLTAFEEYWQGKPYLEGLDLCEPGAGDSAGRLATGEIHLVTEVPPAKVREAAQWGGGEIRTRPRFVQHMLAFNLSGPPLEDVNVRRALCSCIDREDIINSVLGGLAVPLDSFMPPHLYNIEECAYTYPFDAERAVELLNEAGWYDTDSDGIVDKGGEPLLLDMPTSDQELRLRLTREVARQMEAVGVRVEVRPLPAEEYFREMRAGHYDVSYWLLVPGRPDPSGWTANLRSDAFWNVTQMRDNPKLASTLEQVDELIMRGVSLMDRAQREQVYEELQRLLMREALCGFLWHELGAYAIADGVHGVRAPFDFYFLFQGAWLQR